MSYLPDNNAEESHTWLDRARIQVDLAGFAAGRQYWHEACHHLVCAAELAVKAVYISENISVPRRHILWDLLLACPLASVREQVSQAFVETALNRFSGYYFSVYPDGEDADQGIYIWCSRITEQVVKSVEEALL